MITWAEVQARAAQPPRVLNEWRAQRVRADASSLTIDDLARLYDAPGGLSRIDERTAMRASAVYACVALIAGKVAALPLQINERTPDGPRRLEQLHDYWWLLNERPHPGLSATTFWRYVVESMMLAGDGFVEIVRSHPSSSVVYRLKPHHPRRVDPFIDSRGVKLFRIAEDGRQRAVNEADMLHFATGFGWDGLRSMSPIQYAGQTAIGIALAADEYSARFFQNSARPDIVLTTDGKLSPEQQQQIRTAWASRHQGPTLSHLPAVLSGGLKLEKITMSAEDAELIATRGFQIEELARIWGVPPFMIGHNEKTTSWGSGVAAMGAGFVRYTLENYTDPIENEINHKFWPSRQRLYVEHDTTQIERAELKDRFAAYRVALGRAGEPAFMTVNDVRRLERLPAVPGGDELNRGTQPAQPTKEADDEEPSPDTARE